MRQVSESMPPFKVLALLQQLQEARVDGGVVESHVEDSIHVQVPLVGKQRHESFVDHLCRVGALDMLETNSDAIGLPVCGNEVAGNGHESELVGACPHVMCEADAPGTGQQEIFDAWVQLHVDLVDDCHDVRARRERCTVVAGGEGILRALVVDDVESVVVAMMARPMRLQNSCGSKAVWTPVA